MRMQKLTLTGMVVLALVALGCAPAADSAATEAALEAMHAEETQVAAGPDLHVVLTSAETVAAGASALPDAIDLGLLAATNGDLEIPVPHGAVAV